MWQVFTGKPGSRRSMILPIILLGILVWLLPLHAQADIYRDAIPHLKACISKIHEIDPQFPPGKTISLREVCPVLSDFLSYEPLSEVDPPLENYTTLSQLDVLVQLLESSRRAPVKSSGKTAFKVSQDFSSPADKPFFVALTQWMMTRVYGLSYWIEQLTGFGLTLPKYQHTIYVGLANASLAIILALGYLYLVLQFKHTPIYTYLFRKYIARQPAVKKYTLRRIAAQKLVLQLPLLENYFRKQLQRLGITEHRPQLIDKQLRSQDWTNPELPHFISRLLNIFDRAKYSSTAISVHDIQQIYKLLHQIDLIIDKANAKVLH